MAHASMEWSGERDMRGDFGNRRELGIRVQRIWWQRRIIVKKKWEGFDKRKGGLRKLESGKKDKGKLECYIRWKIWQKKLVSKLFTVVINNFWALKLVTTIVFSCSVWPINVRCKNLFLHLTLTVQT